MLDQAAASPGAPSLHMTRDLLHRIDPARNMARFYRVEVSADLFGLGVVERQWGRIGAARGQSLLASYPTLAEAQSAALRLVAAKLARGYRAA